jgi:hypothetical protein
MGIDPSPARDKGRLRRPLSFSAIKPAWKIEPVIWTTTGTTPFLRPNFPTCSNSGNRPPLEIHTTNMVRIGTKTQPGL